MEMIADSSSSQRSLGAPSAIKVRTFQVPIRTALHKLIFSLYRKVWDLLGTVEALHLRLVCVTFVVGFGWDLLTPFADAGGRGMFVVDNTLAGEWWYSLEVRKANEGQTEEPMCSRLFDDKTTTKVNIKAIIKTWNKKKHDGHDGPPNHLIYQVVISISDFAFYQITLVLISTNI